MTDSNTSASSVPLALRKERIGLMLIFFVHGAIFASWAGRIPQLQERLMLTDGQLGISMLCLAIGALVSMPAAGALGAYITTARTTTFFSLGMVLMLATLPTAPSWLAFSMILFIFGFVQGGMDVSMNAHAVQVERDYARPIMSSFHGMFSAGGMTGGAVSALMCALHIAPSLHYLVMIAVFVPLTAWVCKNLSIPESVETGEKAPLFAIPDRHIVVLALVAFCSFIGEGAVSDWSAVYINHELHGTASQAAAGFTLFCIMMTVCRFAGDWILSRLGAVKVLMFGGVIAGAGLALSVVVNDVVAALAAYTFVGIGFACMVPVAFSTAGRNRYVPPSIAIAGVATLGYFGFVIAPPIIGLLADRYTLRVALWLPTILSFAVSLLAPFAVREGDAGFAGD